MVGIFLNEYVKFIQHNLGPRALLVAVFYAQNILLVAVGISLIYVANKRVSQRTSGLKTNRFQYALHILLMLAMSVSQDVFFL